MDIDLNTSIPLPDVDGSFEVSDLDVDSGILSEVLNLPDIPINIPLLDHQPSVMDTAFLNLSLSDSFVDRIAELAISDTTSPRPSSGPPPASEPNTASRSLPSSGPLRSVRSRPGRFRNRTSEQKSHLDQLLGQKRVRFASGSDRNVQAQKLGLPATEIFKLVGGNRRDV